MRYAIKTLGCKVNQFDAFSFEDKLSKEGFEYTTDYKMADVVVVFTCAVTENATKQARQIIRKIQKENPLAEIRVLGCYARLKPDEIKKLGAIPIVNQGEINLPLNQPRSRAYLKVQDGCSNECKYCVIRLARGKPKSIHFEKVIANAKKLRDAGYREITLCGIHIGSYGEDFEGKINLSDLLEMLLKEVSGVRFRLSSLHPHEVDEKLINLWGHNDLCRYMHLSIQSGDDEVLESMGRKPARKQVEKVINEIKRREPNTFISADLIVGYPGETDEQFESTLKLVNDFPFAWFHVFPFSAREGTKAFDLKTLPNDVVQKRMKPLLEIADQKRFEFVESQIGKELEALVMSGVDENGFVKAITDNYIVIYLPNKFAYREKACAIAEKREGSKLWGSWK